MNGYSLALLFFDAEKPAGGTSEHMVAIFLIEIVLMLFLGRLLGEVMQRFGQPAVMGQLVAGVILGPSIFGHFLPGVYNSVFPDVPSQKKMIDAVSQLGILMLLLLTGMETDLKLVNKMRRMAFLTSISGIVVPFACGYVLGEYLPDAMVPDPQRRLVTSLFLATALSISSVKIVAMVITEVGFLRRNVGQIILASAILDDTIGWIIIAIIGGIASGGAVEFKGAGLAFLGTIAFLAFSFTIGRRMVAWAIRWSNDHLIMEMPVISVILVFMILMSLLTDLIGVHTVLGAFVVGILVGQSPILTKHIEEQLRGLIVALFAPIFFAVAGREIDLTVMNSVYQLELAAAFILIASVGKVGGAFLGGTLSGLGHRASTALAVGMNARGSTEVIVATIGLSLGVLNRDLFTLIVVMAIVTTLMTPPLLRWALHRIPPTGEEKERLERENAQAKQFVPNIERILIAADASEDGKLASMLAGLFAGTQNLLSTVLDYEPAPKRVFEIADETPAEFVKSAVVTGSLASTESDEGPAQPTVIVSDPKAPGFIDSVLAELPKGYDMIFLGADRALISSAPSNEQASLAVLLSEFSGVTAISVAKGNQPYARLAHSPRILLPITGTDYSQRAAEVAVTLARASAGTLTALHVAPPASEVDVLRRPDELIASGRSIVAGVADLAKHWDLSIRRLVKVSNAPEKVIMRELLRSRHDLVVVGVKSRGDDKNVSFGRRISVLLESSPCSVLVVNS
jgi:Kef-type K+ transport system membrane component KefB/nucleotide-binding universal stress UspA family protein